MATLLLASRNPHKLREFARLLAPHEVEALPGDVVLPPETGETYGENALAKAVAATAATGRPALADDSGIEAAALGGAPGVRSARFAGDAATDEANLRLLLARAPAGSALAYVCVIAWSEPAGPDRAFEGRCTGVVAGSPRGSRGFGYDPAFLPDAGGGDGRTMAELSDAEKDAISHRGLAARALLAWLGER